MYDILLLNCRLLRPDSESDSDVVDIAIASGKIVEIAPYISTDARLKLDLQQKLVSPPFVESHIHLDSALTAGQPRWNQSGTLFEGIDIWRDRKQNLDLEDIKTRAIATLQQQATQGVLFARTHVDTSEPSLTALQALLEVREEVKDWMALQVVAFPQDGIYGSNENESLLEKALQLGADAVGGIPHYELTREDGLQSVHRIFELAEQYDRLIDIHCDEIDDDQSRFLEVVAAYALRSGMGARVTASHTTAFGSYNNAYAQKLLGLVARAQINFVANPLINITLQGRTDTYPKRRGLTRVKELWQAGINVSLGHDCIQDCWYSLGTGNMLDVSAMLVHVSQMTGMAEINACYDMAAWHGAKTLNVQDSYGIEVGKPANLIVLDASDRFDAIRRRATVSYVIARGRLIAKTESPKSQWLPTIDGLQAETFNASALIDADTDADEILESLPIVSTSEDSVDVEEDMAIATPDDIVDDSEIANDADSGAEATEVDESFNLDSNRDEDTSLFTIVELGDRLDDPVEKALSQLDQKMALNGSLNGSLNASLNGSKPFRDMELNGANLVSGGEDLSAYSLDDLADEMPDIDEVEESQEERKAAIPKPIDDEVVNDPATIYSIEQLVNELFSKEI